VGNRASGLYANHHIVGSDWFNNTGYRNGINFNFLGRLVDNVTDVPGSGHRVRNNLSYRGRSLVASLKPGGNEVDHNSFMPDMKLRDGDFVSIDETQLMWPRQANGDLPVMTFLHPAAGSALIDGGVDVGLPFRGARPDIGAFEH
jgi:hypothetical protein